MRAKTKPVIAPVELGKIKNRYNTKMCIMGDSIRTRLRVPMCYLSSHKFYSVYFDQKKNMINVHLILNDNEVYRPCPTVGAYLVSIRGAISLSHRVFPTETREYVVAVTEYDDRSIVISIDCNLFEAKPISSLGVMVADVIGRG